MWSLVPQCLVDGLPSVCQGERLDCNSILLTRHLQHIFPEILQGSPWAHSTAVSTNDVAVSIVYISLVIKTLRAFVFIRTLALSSFMVLVNWEPEGNVPNWLQKKSEMLFSWLLRHQWESHSTITNYSVYWLNN